MRGQRWPWWLGATLLLAAGAAAAWSTYLHWLPCRGSMLSGSIVRDYVYGPAFSDACLQRMDGGMPFLYLSARSEQVPGATELAVVAMVLVGLAWLAPVLALRQPVAVKSLLALPGLANLVLALVAWSARGKAGDLVVDWLWVIVDLAAVVAALVVLVGPAACNGYTLRLLVLLWATTAFGVFQGMFSYASMSTFSDANWDVPPGTGYTTAAVLVLAAVLTAILTLASRRRRPEPVSSPKQPAAVP